MPWHRPVVPQALPDEGVTVCTAESSFVQTTVLLTPITSVIVAGENPQGLLAVIQLAAPEVMLT